MKIKLSKSQFENLDLSTPHYAYRYLREHDFDRSMITTSIITALAKSSRDSWNTAKNLNWENIPDELISSISKVQYLSYLWARHVDFNEAKIPDVIKKAILNGHDDRWKYYYDKGILNKSRQESQEKELGIDEPSQPKVEEPIDNELFTITERRNMKIKFSKSQWEQVGKTAGWLKKSQNNTGAFWNSDFNQTVIAVSDVLIQEIKNGINQGKWQFNLTSSYLQNKFKSIMNSVLQGEALNEFIKKMNLQGGQEKVDLVVDGMAQKSPQLVINNIVEKFKSQGESITVNNVGDGYQISFK